MSGLSGIGVLRAKDSGEGSLLALRVMGGGSGSPCTISLISRPHAPSRTGEGMAVPTLLASDVLSVSDLESGFATENTGVNGERGLLPPDPDPEVYDSVYWDKDCEVDIADSDLVGDGARGVAETAIEPLLITVRS